MYLIDCLYPPPLSDLSNPVPERWRLEGGGDQTTGEEGLCRFCRHTQVGDVDLGRTSSRVHGEDGD